MLTKYNVFSNGRTPETCLGTNMPSINNPLRQYFRRPSLYLKLPSGTQAYTPDVVDYPETGELPIFPMTAIDEITSRTPDALFNGSAIVDLIKSCVPAIKNPWAITNIDLDAVLIGIRAASEGTEMEITSICPACNEDSKYGVNLINILAGFRPGNYDEELKINDLAIKFRPLTYKEINQTGSKQFEIQRIFTQLETIEDLNERNRRSTEALQKINLVTIEIIGETIEHIRTPDSFVTEKEFIIDFLQNCDKKTYELIKETNIKLRQSTETKPLQIQCVACNHEYSQPFTLNITDFFE